MKLTVKAEQIFAQVVRIDAGVITLHYKFDMFDDEFSTILTIQIPQTKRNEHLVQGNLLEVNLRFKDNDEY